MRRFLIVLALAACQMQAGPGEAPGLAGLSDEVIAVTPLGAPGAQALPTDPAPLPPAVALPTEEGSPVAGSSGAGSPVTGSSVAGTSGAEVVPDGAEAVTEAAEAGAPPVISVEERRCTRAGGSWAKVGALGRICIHPTRDSGKSCRKKSDCRGECLAQSGTCSPIQPLMGCNEVLDDAGRRMTQCLQ